MRIESDSKKPADIGKLAVRSVSGRMVPLSAIVSVRMTAGRAYIDRFNMYPMVEVSANPAAGISLDQVHAICETLFGVVRKELALSEGYPSYGQPKSLTKPQATCQPKRMTGGGGKELTSILPYETATE